MSIKSFFGIGAVFVFAAIVANFLVGEQSSKSRSPPLETAPALTQAEKARNRNEGCALMMMTVLKAVPTEVDVVAAEAAMKDNCPYPKAATISTNVHSL